MMLKRILKSTYWVNHNNIKPYLLFISILFFSSYASQKLDSKKLILGNWEGTIDSVKAVLAFDRDLNGSLKYSNASIPFKFKYQFKDDSVIVFVAKQRTTRHFITIKEDKLRILPYPKGRHETIELFNEIEFNRVK